MGCFPPSEESGDKRKSTSARLTRGDADTDSAKKGRGCCDKELLWAKKGGDQRWGGDDDVTHTLGGGGEKGLPVSYL